MDLEHFQVVYEKYREAVDQLPSLITDPQEHRRAWEQISRLHDELASMFDQ